MSVDGGVTGSASKRLIVTVGYVLARFGVFIAFAQSKIDHVADRTLVAVAHKEIVRFHVTVDEVVGVHVLEAGDHLISQHAHGLQSELTAAVLEQILE